MQKIHSHFTHYAILYLLLAIGGIYLQTMLPGQAFHDPGEFQTVIYTLQIPHPTGFPVYVLLGRLLTWILPIGELAWRANFLSIVYSLGALYFLYRSVLLITDRVFPGLVSVGIFAFSVTFWKYAGMANPHSLNYLFAMMLLFEALLVWKKHDIRYLYLWFATLGLALGNHLFILYTLPGYALFFLILWRKCVFSLSLQRSYICCLCAVIPLFSYVLLPIRDHAGREHLASYSLRTFEGFSRHVSGQDFQGLMFAQGPFTSIWSTITGWGVIVEHIGVVAIGFAVVGIYFLWKSSKTVSMLLFVQFLTLSLFAHNYPTADPHRYYTLYVSLVCLCAGLEILVVYSASRIAGSGIALLVIGMLLGISYPRATTATDVFATAYARDIFTSVDAHSVIVTWWHYYTPLWHRQSALLERPDILIMNTDDWISTIDSYLGERPVYLVEFREELHSRYSLTQAGNLWSVERRVE